MKKNMGMRVLTGAIAISTICSMSAFAADTEDTSAAPQEEGVVASQEPAAQTEAAEAEEPVAEPEAEASEAEKPETEAQEAEEAEEPEEDTSTEAQVASGYIARAGIVDVVNERAGYKEITIHNGPENLILSVPDDILVLNRADNRILSLKLNEVKQGEQIVAVIPENAPMTATIPPMTSGAVALVVNGDNGSVCVGNFDSDLVNKEDLLKLNVTNNTVLVDQTGAALDYRAVDLANQDLLVFYKATTKSIPAQTMPSFVMVLGEAPAVEEAAAEETEAEAEAEDAPAMVALRTVADEAGYTIKWTSNDEPVVLEKDGISVEINVGESTYTKNGEAQEASGDVELQGSQIYVPADLAEALSE